MIRFTVVTLALLFGMAGCGPAAQPTDGAAQVRGESSEAAHGHAGEEEHTEASEGSGAQITPEAAREVGIAVQEAGPVKLRETLPLYGSVRANAERVRNVRARFPGVVRSVRKSVGDTVTRGEVLATVESNESLQTYPVTAPIAGVITARQINPGETAREEPLFEITDLSTVWVELSLFPRDLEKVRVGQPVHVASADGALAAEGRIVFVSALGSSGSQSVTARVLLDNASRQWTPGRYVTGNVVVSESPVPIAVRRTALQTLEGRSVVFVPTEQGFVPRPVQVGRSDGRWTEVVGGLSAGEQYVAEGSFVVKAELGKSEAEHEH